MEFNLKDLNQHVLEIANSLINQISNDDAVHSWVTEKNTQPDAVINHHLIDLLSELNSQVFWHYCTSLFSWLSDEKNGYSDHPFTLDSYTKFCNTDKKNTKLITDIISSKQLKDGRFTIYTALLPGGGDYFSTLWATKILINYDKDVFENEIKKAIKYLLKEFEIGAQTISQKGFLLFLLLKYSPEEYKTKINLLEQELFPALKQIDFSKNIIESINDTYLIEDFIELYKYSLNDEIKEVILEKIQLLFNLNKEFDFPEKVKQYSEIIPESPYFQFLLKSAIIGLKTLKLFDNYSIALELNSYLHSNYRKIKYAGIESEKHLKNYKEHYGDIAKEFQKYDSELKKIWENSDSNYEHSIFLMMPFKSDLYYRNLTDQIKETCENNGFKAFRVDDEYRSPYDLLWDNIVLNMLSCKYGISIYVSEKTVDKVSDELKFFQNPNVALEYGLMKSRGKKVLILKDTDSITPSDLKGFLWKPFDIKNPDKSVPPVLTEWLNELKKNNSVK